MVNRATAVAVGLLADRFLGERPLDPHPVSLFGTAMSAVEERIYADDRLRGAVHTAVGVGTAVLAGVIARSTALCTYVAVAGRALGEAATDIESALTAGDVDRARSLLPSLVGRDPSGLDEKEIARAAVESVAENTVDAVVAPAMWAVALGAPGVLGYRAVNTLDAMVGHRSPRYLRYGWASARLDDAANWAPARVTAALVAAARPRSALAVVRTVRRDAPAHPSPNAGVAEAAFAAALGLRLGGENRYGDQVEVRPPLGDGRPPDAADIGRAVGLSRDVTAALAAGLFVTGGVSR
jgi:adenosylcobinamide-phosphate synthase